MEDLELATQKLPGASQIYESKAPGGGKCVTFHDPTDGFPFHLIYSQTPVEMTETFPELEYNFPTSKHRPVGKYHHFNKRPSSIHKLGHVGCCVTDSVEALEFYTTDFNFKPSGIVHDRGNDISAFCYLDRGDEMVDHHCFFLFEGLRFHVHHSSFKVHDFDIQLLRHNFLEQKGYENC